MTYFHAYLFYFLAWLISIVLILKFFKSHLPQILFSLPITVDLNLFGQIPQQAFHRLTIRYAPLEINFFIKLISRKANMGETVHLNAELVKVTNNLILQILLGESCSEKADDIRKLIFEITEAIGNFDLSYNLWLFKSLDLQGFWKRVNNICRRFDALIDRIIKEYEQAKMHGLQSEGKDLLSILLVIAQDERIEMNFTRGDIKALIRNMLVVGTNNSAIIIEWALSELINHPNVMRKAITEIDNVVGKNRLLQESDIPNLPYLQAIVKETLRLHPPVPLIPRKPTENQIIAGYHVHPNTPIFINVWALGRDPYRWENPLTFRPERFEDKQMDVGGDHLELLPFESQMVHAMFGTMIQCFDWKAGNNGNLISVDMGERRGLNLHKANPLVCVPVA